MKYDALHVLLVTQCRAIHMNGAIMEHTLYALPVVALALCGLLYSFWKSRKVSHSDYATQFIKSLEAITGTKIVPANPADDPLNNCIRFHLTDGSTETVLADGSWVVARKGAIGRQ